MTTDEPMRDEELKLLRDAPRLAHEVIGRLIARIDKAENRTKELEDDVSDYRIDLDGDCGPQISPFFQPCCGILWEEDHHKETCKYYCKICTGHNEYCKCEGM